MSTATRPVRDQGSAQAAAGPPARWAARCGGLGMPAEKPANFRGTLRRLLRRLRPERVTVGAVIVLALTSVAFAVVGPKILGNATEHPLRGRRRQATARRPDQGAGGRRAAGAGQTRTRPTCSPA